MIRKLKDLSHILSKNFFKEEPLFFEKLPSNSAFSTLYSFLSNEVTKLSVEANYSILFDKIYAYNNKKMLYFPIEENSQFTIAIFFFPKGIQMPLHDHPNMMVISKILEGEVERTSIDFKNDDVQINLPKKIYFNDKMDEELIIKDLKLKKDVLKKEELDYLTPSKYNLHQFKARENSAMLDILVPSYNLKERYCNFYEILKEEGDSVEIKYRLHPSENDSENVEFFKRIRS